MRRSSTARCCRPTKAATSTSSFPAEDRDDAASPARRHRRHRDADRRRAAPDLPRLLAHCRALLDEGCDAINLLGTTGEATAFSVEQRLDVMRAVAEGGLPLDRFMVGTGVPALDDTVRLTRAACELGFAGALVLPPFFYPQVPDDGLVAYVEALARRVDHPSLAIYLYHIPQNTKVPWPVEVVVRLRERLGATLVGLKDSAGDLAYARAVVAAVADFDVFPSSEAALGSADATASPAASPRPST
jgi:4-hydroxy-tetrahydrodipicolinate synthase